MKPLLVVLALVLAGCAAQADDPARGADQAAIDALYARFSQAYADLDPAAVVALYTDDAYYLPGDDGPIRHGKDALARSFRFLAQTREAGGRLHIAFRSVDRAIEGDLAYDVGYYRLASTRPDGAERVSVGKFTVVLKRQTDGTWRFHVDSFSDAPNDAFDQ